MNYKEAIKKISGDRKNQLLLYEQLCIKASANNPILRQIEKEIFLIKNLEDNSEKSKEKLDALNKQKNDILRELNLESPPPPSCPICLDTGIKENKPCSCAIKLVYEGDSINTTFENCDFSVFAENERERIKNIYQTLQGFCDNFPTKNKLNFLLYGGTGTGKTFLASCIADNLNKRGFSVIFCSAFEFTNKMLAYHTALLSEKSQHISPFLDCDLLIIDDLGSENIIKNVTVEYFYNVLNERIRLKRHTLITTNLDTEMLTNRYDKRVASRLFDKQHSTGFALSSIDLRKKM